LDAGVAIAAIDTGWDGWNPKLSIRGLAIHDRARPDAAPVLQLPRVDLVIAWTSVPLFDLRLEQLTIDRPQFAVRRDTDGRLHLAGIEIDLTAQNEDTRLTDWLLRQPEIVVRDALVTWTDELRGAPQLVLDDVQFRLEQSFGRHRFGLLGKPPATLAAPLDLRGDVTLASLADWRTAKGNLYVRLDYADIALWRQWIPLPVAVDSGKGALRVWFEFVAGKPQGIIADVELADVRAKLRQDLSPLDLTHVSGRLGWKDDPGAREFWTQGLTFETHEALVLPPMELRLTLSQGADGNVTGGRASFDQVEMAPLAAVAAHLPVPDIWRRELTRFAVRGNVADGRYAWKGPPETPATYSASGRFKSLAVAPQDGLPQVSGVSGSFTANEGAGELKLDSRDMAVALPRTFAAPLAFTTAGGRVQWEKAAEEWRVRFDELRFANAHTSGRVAGSWRSQSKGAGAVDITAELTRLDLAHLDRYLPLGLDPVTRDWLRLGIKQGVARDLRLAVSGNLADFPFPDNRGGRFIATLNVTDVTLAYADAWPEMTAIDAEVKFEGSRITVTSPRARIFGAQLGPVEAQIADTTVAHPRFSLTGEAAGPTSDFLRFIANSPLAGGIGRFSDGAQVAGNGAMMLSFARPLGQQGGAKVAGQFRFLENEIRLPGLPPLAQVNGRLAFTEQGVSAEGLTLKTLGGAATIRIASTDDGVHVTGAGTSSLAQTNAYFDWPLLRRVSGSAQWHLSAITRPEFATWTLESDLQGVTIDLPAPLGKTAATTAPLKIERHDVPGKRDEDLIRVDYRGPLRLTAHRHLAAGVPTVDRALLLLGNAVARGGNPERPGIWVRGQLDELDIDEWLAVRLHETSRQGSAGDTRPDSLEVQGVDLDVVRFGLFGRALHDLKLSARHVADDWRLTINGREIEGTANWRGRSAALPNGRVQARLVRLSAPGNGEPRPQRRDVAGANSETNTWPELDIVADAFFSEGRNLGKLELVAQPAGADWRITKLTLVNDAGRLDANGSWRVSRERHQTQLEVVLSAQNAGAYLARLGLPDSVKNAPTKITGQLAWSGAPNEFDYPTLTGNLHLQSGAGQFTKIDPGIGKLLGVLSLQALPRRITLDFRDVFSEGFAFDEITADLRIQNGTMHTDNLRLSGPAAKVTISGDIDLEQETQRLSVRVQPALSSTISAGAAVLFLANPLVGAAVGAGTLLAHKVLRDPFEQMFSYDYRVTGSWSDPVVERGGGRAASRNPATAPGAAPETVQ
ncbi:MAG: YhdP family protein, partial [Casimicrobiaceae bacterium]